MPLVTCVFSLRRTPSGAVGVGRRRWGCSWRTPQQEIMIQLHAPAEKQGTPNRSVPQRAGTVDDLPTNVQSIVQSLAAW